MLNKSIPLLREKNKTLENLSYRDAEAAMIMRDVLSQTDFWGMSVCLNDRLARDKPVIWLSVAQQVKIPFSVA